MKAKILKTNFFSRLFLKIQNRKNCTGLIRSIHYPTRNLQPDRCRTAIRPAESGHSMYSAAGGYPAVRPPSRPGVCCAAARGPPHQGAGLDCGFPVGLKAAKGITPPLGAQCAPSGYSGTPAGRCPRRGQKK